MGEANRKRPRIIREDIKDTHTSHWDLDYVSREELEELMTNGTSKDTDEIGSDGEASEEQNPSKRKPVPPANEQ